MLIARSVKTKESNSEVRDIHRGCKVSGRSPIGVRNNRDQSGEKQISDHYDALEQ